MRRSNRWSKDKKPEKYNWLPAKHKIDTRQEPEDDESQIEALLVDCGITELMFGDD